MKELLDCIAILHVIVVIVILFLDEGRPFYDIKVFLLMFCGLVISVAQ